MWVVVRCQSDALSGNTQMNAAEWDAWHTFRLEWETPESDPARTGGYLRWYMDDELIYSVSGATLNKHRGAQARGQERGVWREHVSVHSQHV